MADDTPLKKMIAQSRRRTEILEQLGAAGQNREQALKAARRDLNTIRRLTREGVGAGMTITEIAEASGVSRVTLYKLLDTKPKARLVKRKS